MLKTYSIDYDAVYTNSYDWQIYKNINDPYIALYDENGSEKMGTMAKGIYIYNLLPGWTADCDISVDGKKVLSTSLNMQTVLPVTHSTSKSSMIVNIYENGNQIDQFECPGGNFSLINKLEYLKNKYPSLINFTSSTYHIEFQTPIKIRRYDTKPVCGARKSYLYVNREYNYINYDNYDIYIYYYLEKAAIYNNTLCLVTETYKPTTGFETINDDGVHFKYENNTDRIIPLCYTLVVESTVTNIHVDKRVYPTLSFNYQQSSYNLVTYNSVNIKPIIRTLDKTEPLSYTLEGSLPEGLSLNSENGIISGKAVVTGEYNVTVTASNSYTSKSFNLLLNVTNVDENGNTDCTDCSNCIDCINCVNCEYCYKCVDCDSCHNCKYCTNCINVQ